MGKRIGVLLVVVALVACSGGGDPTTTTEPTTTTTTTPTTTVEPTTTTTSYAVQDSDGLILVLMRGADSGYREAICEAFEYWRVEQLVDLTREGDSTMFSDFTDEDVVALLGVGINRECPERMNGFLGEVRSYYGMSVRDEIVIRVDFLTGVAEALD